MHLQMILLSKRVEHWYARLWGLAVRQLPAKKPDSEPIQINQVRHLRAIGEISRLTLKQLLIVCAESLSRGGRRWLLFVADKTVNILCFTSIRLTCQAHVTKE